MGSSFWGTTAAPVQPILSGGMHLPSGARGGWGGWQRSLGLQPPPHAAEPPLGRGAAPFPGAAGRPAGRRLNLPPAPSAGPAGALAPGALLCPAQPGRGSCSRPHRSPKSRLEACSARVALGTSERGAALPPPPPLPKTRSAPAGGLHVSPGAVICAPSPAAKVSGAVWHSCSLGQAVTSHSIPGGGTARVLGLSPLLPGWTAGPRLCPPPFPCCPAPPLHCGCSSRCLPTPCPRDPQGIGFGAL